MKNIWLLLLLLLFAAACSSDQAAEKKPDNGNSAARHFQVIPVTKTALPAVIKLPGQLAAYEEVSIYPKVNGYVKSVNVDIGSVVRRGQLLMELEAPELVEASLAARERYARALADYSIDREHYQRLLEASGTAGAVSPLDLSTLRSKMQADSALSNAEKNNWQMQQTMQTYLRVIAPFDGVITERNVHPGALISATMKDQPMLELKQVAHLRLQVDVPENIAVGLKERDSITFYTSAFPGRKMKGVISRRSMNVNIKFRSERMEIDVQNKNNELAPGMYADVLVYSKGSGDALVVPESAVITSTEKKYVVKVLNNLAVQVDVSTGNAANGQIEIHGDLKAGDEVVANPPEDLRSGDRIRG